MSRARALSSSVVSRMLIIAVRVLLALLVLWGVFVLLAWLFQNRLAFPGPHAPLPEPSAYGIARGEIVAVVTTDGVTLRGWYLPPEPPPTGTAPALIWFYGNMETVAGIAPILREFRPPATALLALDYRGYGASDGTPTEAGLYRDAQAAWAYLATRPEIDAERIAVYGRSLGSAVALYLATERPVRAVVLDSPFSSGRDMADEHYSLVPKALLTIELDNVARAARVSAPVLIFHGSADRIAPLHMGQAVAGAARATLVVLDGAGHNDTYDVGGRAYRERMHAFLAEALAERRE